MQKDGPAIGLAGYKFMYIIKVTDILVKNVEIMKVFCVCGNNVVQCPGDVDRFHYKVTSAELISYM